jgi:hypothetical protein
MVAVAAVWAIALAGGVIGIVALARGNASDTATAVPIHRVVSDATGPRLGGRVDTSFGSFAVNAVEQLAGPTPAMHLSVPRGMTPVQVRLMLNNLQHKSLVFHRRTFRLVGSAGTYKVGWASRIRLIRPLTTRTVLLRFSIPPSARLPQLEYRDAVTGATTLIELGSAQGLVKFNPTTHKHGR